MGTQKKNSLSNEKQTTSNEAESANRLCGVWVFDGKTSRVFDLLTGSPEGIAALA